jgi:hypothetical protein
MLVTLTSLLTKSSLSLCTLCFAIVVVPEIRTLLQSPVTLNLPEILSHPKSYLLLLQMEG